MLEVIFYLGSILASNFLVIKFGIIHFAGLNFPAGAITIGLCFSARDLVQRRWGDWGCWIWMICASLITLAFNYRIAIASMSAFLIAEGVDWLVYKTYKGTLIKRIVLSNIFGIPLDSIIFVSLAFGPYWPVIIGQTIIKLLSGLLVIPFLYKRSYVGVDDVT